jgi:NADPH2:quinone reductase
VLVHAGAGGVGIAVTQLATAWGARVIATAGGPEKVAVCREQGAAAAIDYQTDDFVRAVTELTDGRGADVVIDPVGGDVFARSLNCLAFEGRIVPAGAAGGRPAPVDPLALTAANVSVVGLSWGSAYPYQRPAEVRAAYEELFGMLGTQVRPVIDRVIGLEEAPAALADLEARRTVGKIIVLPGGVS